MKERDSQSVLHVRAESSRLRLQKCAISGLPIGYLPRVRLHVRAAIPFAQFTFEEARKITYAALNEDAPLEDRIFAFCTLFFQIPEPLLQLHALPVPDFTLPQLARMLEPKPLRAFFYAISQLRALPERFYKPREDRDLQTCILPAYSVSSDFCGSNTSLHDFPNALNRWLSILQSGAIVPHSKRVMPCEQRSKSFRAPLAGANIEMNVCRSLISEEMTEKLWKTTRASLLRSSKLNQNASGSISFANRGSSIRTTSNRSCWM
jgi:hypothetical protein